jgi:hypothetical protein
MYIFSSNFFAFLSVKPTYVLMLPVSHAFLFVIFLESLFTTYFVGYNDYKTLKFTDFLYANMHDFSVRF